MRVRIRAMCAAVVGKSVNAACTHVDDGRAVHTALQVCKVLVCSTHWKVANDVGDCARAPRGSAATSSSAGATAASDTEKLRRAPQRPLPRRGALAGWSTCSIS
jgi:hypothetical protein